MTMTALICSWWIKSSTPKGREQTSFSHGQALTSTYRINLSIKQAFIVVNKMNHRVKLTILMMRYHRNKVVLFRTVGIQHLVQNITDLLQLDDLTSDFDIVGFADNFAWHFEKTCTEKTEDGNRNLKTEDDGRPFTKDLAFDAELTEGIIDSMKKARLPG